MKLKRAHKARQVRPVIPDGHFLKFDTGVMRSRMLKPVDKIVYAIIYNNNPSYQGLRTIASIANVTVKVVQKSVRRLVEVRLISITKRPGDLNLYTILRYEDSKCEPRLGTPVYPEGTRNRSHAEHTSVPTKGTKPDQRNHTKEPNQPTTVAGGDEVTPGKVERKRAMNPLC